MPGCDNPVPIPTMTDSSTDVLIVGAGPVGLTLAMSLAQRGVAVTIVELRKAGVPPSVKCNHVSARSMEIFRRLGVAGAIRNAGLPPDYPNDVSYRTTTLGIELTRIRIPSRNMRYLAIDGPDGWWPTPEPPHRINQIFLEPVLFRAASITPGVTIHNECRFDGCAQGDHGVTATIVELASGSARTISCKYLVGCDGGTSLVRKAIGAVFRGDPVVQRVQSTYIRAPELISMIADSRAWSMFSLNPRRCGNVYAIDGKELWLIHNYLRDEEPNFESIDRDLSIRNILGVGPTFQYEVLNKEDWIGRRLVADKFRDRRVFICGDAAHIWVPYAGYGMNAGIADAENLAWLMAAHLNGWADEAILGAHEAERLPITEQVSFFAMNHAQAMSAQRRGVPANIEDQDAEGEAARATLGKAAYELNVQQYCCAGLNFGYFYADSPIIPRDDSDPPAYSMGSFTPSSVPGCRTPHLWLAGHASLYDLHGAGYALLRFDPTINVDSLLLAARSRAVPMKLVDVDPAHRGDVYQHALVLSRPDLHVAWRGDAVPANPTTLIDQIRGAASAGGRR
jgi:2-polyprenyl-6-methoxyphenol hydroxylase-like FAD-dependent oxidoreductase